MQVVPGNRVGYAGCLTEPQPAAPTATSVYLFTDVQSVAVLTTVGGIVQKRVGAPDHESSVAGPCWAMITSYYDFNLPDYINSTLIYVYW